MKPLNLTIPPNPKDVQKAALEAVIDNAKKAEKIVVIVDAYEHLLFTSSSSSFTHVMFLDVPFDMS